MKKKLKNYKKGGLVYSPQLPKYELAGMFSKFGDFMKNGKFDMQSVIGATTDPNSKFGKAMNTFGSMFSADETAAKNKAAITNTNSGVDTAAPESSLVNNEYADESKSRSGFSATGSDTYSGAKQVDNAVSKLGDATGGTSLLENIPGFGYIEKWGSSQADKLASSVGGGTKSGYMGAAVAQTAPTWAAAGEKIGSSIGGPIGGVVGGVAGTVLGVGAGLLNGSAMKREVDRKYKTAETLDLDRARTREAHVFDDAMLRSRRTYKCGGKFKFKYGGEKPHSNNPNALVDHKEVMMNPDGEIQKAVGHNSSQRGKDDQIPVSLENGTRILSDSLGVGNRSFADMASNLSKINSKARKVLDDRSASPIDRKTAELNLKASTGAFDKLYAAQEDQKMIAGIKSAAKFKCGGKKLPKYEKGTNGDGYEEAWSNGFENRFDASDADKFDRDIPAQNDWSETTGVRLTDKQLADITALASKHSGVEGSQFGKYYSGYNFNDSPSDAKGLIGDNSRHYSAAVINERNAQNGITKKQYSSMPMYRAYANDYISEFKKRYADDPRLKDPNFNPLDDTDAWNRYVYGRGSKVASDQLSNIALLNNTLDQVTPTDNTALKSQDRGANTNGIKLDENGYFPMPNLNVPRPEEPDDPVEDPNKPTGDNTTKGRELLTRGDAGLSEPTVDNSKLTEEDDDKTPGNENKNPEDLTWEQLMNGGWEDPHQYDNEEGANIRYHQAKANEPVEEINPHKYDMGKVTPGSYNRWSDDANLRKMQAAAVQTAASRGGGGSNAANAIAASLGFAGKQADIAAAKQRYDAAQIQEANRINTEIERQNVTNRMKVDEMNMRSRARREDHAAQAAELRSKLAQSRKSDNYKARKEYVDGLTQFAGAARYMNKDERKMYIDALNRAFGSMGPGGYNARVASGSNGPTYKMSDETKAKLKKGAGKLGEAGKKTASKAKTLAMSIYDKIRDKVNDFDYNETMAEANEKSYKKGADRATAINEDIKKYGSDNGAVGRYYGDRKLKSAAAANLVDAKGSFTGTETYGQKEKSVKRKAERMAEDRVDADYYRMKKDDDGKFRGKRKTESLDDMQGEITDFSEFVRAEKDKYGDLADERLYDMAKKRGYFKYDVNGIIANVFGDSKYGSKASKKTKKYSKK